MAERLCAMAAEYAGLTPDQATEMTPYDLQLCIEAGGRRLEREHEGRVWLAANLISAHAGKPISMDDLLGPAWTLKRMRRERGLPE
jgi:hypothetical protein